MKRKFEHTRKTILETIALCGMYCHRPHKTGYQHVDMLIATMVREKIIIESHREGRRVFYKKRGKCVKCTPYIEVNGKKVEVYPDYKLDTGLPDVPSPRIPRVITGKIVQNNPDQLKTLVKDCVAIKKGDKHWNRDEVHRALNAGEITYRKACRLLELLDEEMEKCLRP